MARPQSQRTVVSGLSEGEYGPLGPSSGVPHDVGQDAVELTLDGLEALHLVDREGLYREAAAEPMGVSRATLARVLARARRAVAEALVQQRVLVIGGGVVRRGRETSRPCPVHGSRRRRGRGCRCGRGQGRGRGAGAANHERRGRGPPDGNMVSGAGPQGEERCLE